MRSPVAMGMENLARDQRHRVEVVGQCRVLIEHRMVLLDSLGEHDGLRRRELAMYFDADVHFVARRLTVLPHGFDCVLHLVDVCLEIRNRPVFVQERREVADCRESLLPCRRNPLHELLAGVTENVIVDTGLISDRAAH